jgi:hypothetical protein
MVEERINKGMQKALLKFDSVTDSNQDTKLEVVKMLQRFEENDLTQIGRVRKLRSEITEIEAREKQMQKKIKKMDEDRLKKYYGQVATLE